MQFTVKAIKKHTWTVFSLAQCNEHWVSTVISTHVYHTPPFLTKESCLLAETPFFSPENASLFFFNSRQGILIIVPIKIIIIFETDQNI